MNNVNELLVRVYRLLAFVILVAAVGAFTAFYNIDVFYDLSDKSLTWVYWVSVISLFVLIFVIHYVKDRVKAKYLLILFGFVTGLTFGPTIYNFAEAAAMFIVLESFLTTFIIFGLFSLVAMRSKDMTHFQTPLMIVLIMIIILSVVNVFLGVPWVSTLISIVAIILFSGFIVIDTQQILNGTVTDEVDAVLELFLDFINIFSSLLNLSGGGIDDD